MLLQSTVRWPRWRRALVPVTLLLLILGAGGYGPVGAAVQPMFVLSITVPEILALNTSPGYPGLTAGYMNPVTFNGFQVMRFLSTSTTISIRANDTDLRDSQGETIPVGQLEVYRESSAGDPGYLGLSTSDEPIMVFSGDTIFENREFSVTLRMRLTGLETASVPGDPYRVVLTFTATG